MKNVTIAFLLVMALLSGLTVAEDRVCWAPVVAPNEGERGTICTPEITIHQTKTRLEPGGDSCEE